MPIETPPKGLVLRERKGKTWSECTECGRRLDRLTFYWMPPCHYCTPVSEDM